MGTQGNIIPEGETGQERADDRLKQMVIRQGQSPLPNRQMTRQFIRLRDRMIATEDAKRMKRVNFLEQRNQENREKLAREQAKPKEEPKVFPHDGFHRSVEKRLQDQFQNGDANIPDRYLSSHKRAMRQLKKALNP